MASAENVVHTVMEMGAAARVQDYLARGRKHEALDAAALHELHLATFRAFAQTPAPGPARTAHDDCEAEYALRGLEPDFSELQPELEAVTLAAREMLAGIDLTGWLWTGLIERISQDRRSRTCGEVRRRARSRSC